jgi:hypothetical protein
MSFIVRLRDQQGTYGPFATNGEAEEFAQFLSREVDPAFVEPLRSPTTELLGWWRMRSGLNEEVPF